MPNGKSVVALMAENDNGRPILGRPHHISLLGLYQEPPYSRRLLPDLNPACLALEPNADRLFVGDKNGELTLVNLRIPDARMRSFGGVLQGAPESMCCSEDGRTLVVHDSQAVYAWNLSSSSMSSFPRWCHVDSSISCFVITPDSRTILCGRSRGGQSDLVEIDIRTGLTRLLQANMGQPLSRLTISADGRFLACVEANLEIVLLRCHATGGAWQQTSIPGLRTGGAYLASFSPRNATLITSDTSGCRLIAWDLERMELQRQFDRQGMMLIGCDFLDDERILSWHPDNKLMLWDLDKSAAVREIRL